ncbi:carboxypeptidase-like regulatory domain-containing protein [Mucilaginibacter myungsuensis]|uniref:Carboxypeptidase-like regulatory domain-containing protein n=1 Tax=Mucilaginibacter myungsuensis TaxID=649104 RepID=A0A929L4Y6_9SPHI|nr:carboxypeptidase-like regulatory domain-containing protein [Mucilaginibacter myungsuensis]MBE9663316.1 carboxypeptidase-like regulatory domain-containing protein [Mucilaginibacter myungsuensis]MDN3600051.1 carboxypeptidase-like regulatory domain-containing protein [Mucilaginibacter myungsuensis]
MRPNLQRLLFVVFVLITNLAIGQGTYTLSGKVLDDKGHPLHSATVFIGGTKRITGSNEAGEFSFNYLEPGTYQLSVQSLGYAPYSQNVLIHAKPVEVTVNMKLKPVMLNEVKIGKGDRFDEYFKIFQEAFLGMSDNGKGCTILNPRVINFSTQKNYLKADADEFMIIENKRLGYRIRYLLKYFEYNTNNKRANYDGEASFEELDGPEEQKQFWAKNRKETYTGSLRHFLRSVYYNTVQQEGFLAHQLYMQPVGISRVLAVDPRPLNFDTIVNVIDTSFISMKFTSWMVRHDPKKAANYTVNPQADSTAKRLQLANDGTVINLYLPEAVIDSRGSYVNFRSFLIQGYWGRKRMGDQVPFEYQPPVATTQ